jgi:hypothetical protein
VWLVVLIAAILYFAVYRVPGVEIEGTVVQARRVSIVVDISGSMKLNNKQTTLYEHLQALQAADIVVVSRTDTYGFGVSSNWQPDGQYTNLLQSIESIVTSGSDADALFFFSDFYITGDWFDLSDQQGYEQLRQLLRKHPRRLYLDSVEESPSKELIDIANQSGGGLIVRK